MTLKVLMIAFWQAVAVFALCLASKNRFYALLIGLAGAVAVSITGGNPYDVIDVFFVVIATLAAIWKMTPYGEGETPGQMLALAVKVVGVGVILIAGAYYYFFGRTTQAPLRSAAAGQVHGATANANPLVYGKWLRIASTEEGAVAYIAIPALSHRGAIHEFEALIDYPSNVFERGVNYRSMRWVGTIDCEKQAAVLGTATLHSEPMGFGTTALKIDDDPQSQWRTINDVNSPMGAFFQWICLP